MAVMAASWRYGVAFSAQTAIRHPLCGILWQSPPFPELRPPQPWRHGGLWRVWRSWRAGALFLRGIYVLLQTSSARSLPPKARPVCSSAVSSLSLISHLFISLSYSHLSSSLSLSHFVPLSVTVSLHPSAQPSPCLTSSLSVTESLSFFP